MTAGSAYAELHCVSNFSFLRGASHPHELVEQAIECGYKALALTDECSVAGMVRAWQALKDYQQQHPDTGLKLIPGSEFHWQGHLFVVLVADQPGWAELCQLITHCRRQAAKGEYVFAPEDLLRLQHCLLLWRPACSDIHNTLATLQPLHKRLWLLAERLLDEFDSSRYYRILELAEQHQLPLTCASDVHMHQRHRQPLQDCLSAIRIGQPIQEIRAQLFSNAERHLRSIEVLKRIYPPELLASTIDISDRCHFDPACLRYRYPEDLVPANINPSDWLAQQVHEGQQRRFPDGTPAAVQATINRELALIQRKQYEHYFLTLHDIIGFARSQGILCQGRGSAANSVVCYCLGITEVNPLEVSLLFERFISEERHEPPDIDVDFESKRREEVIQYIYRRYGRERAALTATVITYRPRSAVRDAGKALGLDQHLLEQSIARSGWRYIDGDWTEQLLTPALGKPGQLQVFRQLLQEIIGFPRHLSQHTGGFVISADPLNSLVPIENASMPDRTVIQWDKDDLDHMGMMKVDILGLGILSAIRYCLQSLSEQHGKPFNMADIPRDDAATYRMLQKADSVGVFQVESRAQMNMLPRLKPRHYYDLVVQVSIVRPGPIHGDMVHPYLRRRHGDEAVDYPLPELEPILGRTLGIPLFQEQMIAFAMVAAGFSATEADQLRRSMASWRRKGHMHQLRKRLSEALLARGFEPAYVDRLQRQLEGFGEYGFPESHAASFALLVYVTSWLKCHYPALYTCAILNSQPMGFYSPAQLIEDARRHSVRVLPVDINHSGWLHQATDYQHELRLGLCLVKGLSADDAHQVIQHRPTGGYSSINQCQYYSALDSRSIRTLAAANAFAGISNNRYHAQWQVQEHSAHDLLASGEHEAPSWSLLQLDAPSEVDDLLEDYRSLGLSLGRHPLSVLREQGYLGASLSATALRLASNGSEAWISGLVTCRQRPGTAAGVTFITLEDETGNTNVVVWLSTAQRQLKELIHSRLLQVYGKVERDDNSGIVHLVAYRLFTLDHALTQLQSLSHDFH